VAYTESREARRRVYHRRALLGLESSGAPAAECAFHALAALLDEPAFRYSVAAGHEAFAAYATQEALAHFNTARDVAGRMQAGGESIAGDWLGRLYRGRGQALELVNGDEAVQANYEEMRAAGVQRQDRPLEMAALISLSTLYGYYTSLFNPPKASELAREALALARELGDKAAEAGALTGLMMVEVTSAGDNDLVMAYGQQALALARELGLEELQGRILLLLWLPLLFQKQLKPCLEMLSEAQAIWRELGNVPRLAEAFRYRVIVHSAIGDHPRTLAEAPALAALGASIGSRVDEAQGWTHLALAHARQGRFGEALTCTEKVGALSAALGHINEEHGHQWVRIEVYLAAGALAQAEHWADRLIAQRETIMPMFPHGYLTPAALAKIANGKLGEGQALLDSLLPTLSAAAGTSLSTTTMAIAYAHLHLAQGQPEALFAGLEERMRPFREAGFRALLADEYWLRGRAEMALGHYDAAREALLKARETAEAQEERAVLWQILLTLSEVEHAQGAAAAAGALRQEARAMVEDIAAQAGELREPFLGQPAVVQLLGET
jgi:tetratricopeptide (TPR) repeat protein